MADGASQSDGSRSDTFAHQVAVVLHAVPVVPAGRHHGDELVQFHPSQSQWTS